MSGGGLMCGGGAVLGWCGGARSGSLAGLLTVAMIFGRAPSRVVAVASAIRASGERVGVVGRLDRRSEVVGVGGLDRRRRRPYLGGVEGGRCRSRRRRGSGSSFKSSSNMLGLRVVSRSRSRSGARNGGRSVRPVLEADGSFICRSASSTALSASSCAIDPVATALRARRRKRRNGRFDLGFAVAFISGLYRARCVSVGRGVSSGSVSCVVCPCTVSQALASSESFSFSI